MRRIIQPFRFVTNDDIKQSIQTLLSQLEKYNYAIISNPNAVRQFSRTIPPYYRENNIITFFSKNGYNYVVVSHNHKITSKNQNKYEIRTK